MILKIDEFESCYVVYATPNTRGGSHSILRRIIKKPTLQYDIFRFRV